MKALTLTGLFALCALATGDAETKDADTVIGQQAPAFELVDVSGETHSLAKLADANQVVVAFLGTECPLVVNLYANRLERIAQEFADQGVRVIGIMSNAQDSPEDIKAFQEKHRLTFPVLIDESARVADAYGAERTPEVFLLDQDRVIRYHGRIDDQGMVGFIRKEPRRSDLREAMADLFAGQTVREPELEAVGCLIGRPKSPTRNAEVTYARDVAPIFRRRCEECHREGEIGPFSTESYEDVSGWAEMIQEVIDQERMPPWFANPEYGHFSNESRMTDEEKQTIRDWVAAGTPMGDPKDLPAPKQYFDGWNIGEPDEVIAMSDKPFHVPADGVIEYKHYLVDPGFTEDRWLTACEVRPGNRSVVHHVLVFCKEPGQRGFMEIFNGGLIAAYAPGMPSFEAPAGTARRLPAGSRILIQMHYTTNGRAQDDLSSVGFRFCKESEVKQEIAAFGANNFFIFIPPHKDDYVVKSLYQFHEDKILVNMAPHMHMRGKSYRYVADYPDGTNEILLDVPRYDFNWQLQYNLSEPKLMPKGTVLRCEAHYDNSAKNPANPDPSVTVRFGPQTWDEMMIGWFTAMTPPKEDQQAEGETSTPSVSAR